MGQVGGRGGMQTCVLRLPETFLEGGGGGCGQAQGDDQTMSLAGEIQPPMGAGDDFIGDGKTKPIAMVILLCRIKPLAALAQAGDLIGGHAGPVILQRDEDVCAILPGRDGDLVAGMGHASLGSVDWPLLAKLLAGSLPGIWLGSRLMRHTPDRVIRSILSVLLAWAGTKLVMV